MKLHLEYSKYDFFLQYFQFTFQITLNVGYFFWNKNKNSVLFIVEKLKRKRIKNIKI